MNNFCEAALVEPNIIRVKVLNSYDDYLCNPFLLIDNQDKLDLAFVKKEDISGSLYVYLSSIQVLQLGHSYQLVFPNCEPIPLNVNKSTDFEFFDQTYYYDKDDLGYTYNHDLTHFAIWAPLASKVIIKIRKPNENNPSFYNMNRSNCGVYFIDLKGDYCNSCYTYLITNNEVQIETTDPYAKGSTLNGKESVVIDFDSLNNNLNNDKLTPLESPLESIIYEANIRDISISKSSSIIHKGKFLGLSESDRKTNGNNPAGIDYLKHLGVTHVQLLPIFDFKTVDEENDGTTYNWGYDPSQFFVPEGSYGSSSEPVSRIKDLKELIGTLHYNGIRVVMDVVFNHVYEYENHVLEKVVPNYYFRKDANGKLTNASWCGNDFASERPMAKKMLLDCVKHWVKEYGIDGLRFDLMGIIDIDVLNSINDYCKSVNPSFILYGEGWNMGSFTPKGTGTIENQKLIPNYSFFNDSYRENIKYYFVGDDRYIHSAKQSYFGDAISIDQSWTRFEKIEQSINYCECHDNLTLYDFIAKCDTRRTIDENLEILDAINAAIILSFGIPFIHMGQEIGQSKWNENNTYNKGDHFNKFSYSLLDERLKHSNVVKEAIVLRKTLPLYRTSSSSIINGSLSCRDFNNVIYIDVFNKDLISPYKRLHIFLNQNGYDMPFVFENSTRILFCSKSLNKSMDNGTYIPSRCFIMFVED